jgi:hypothetical protein
MPNKRAELSTRLYKLRTTLETVVREFADLEYEIWTLPLKKPKVEIQDTLSGLFSQQYEPAQPADEVGAPYATPVALNVPPDGYPFWRGDSVPAPSRPMTASEIAMRHGQNAALREGGIPTVAEVTRELQSPGRGRVRNPVVARDIAEDLQRRCAPIEQARNPNAGVNSTIRGNVPQTAAGRISLAQELVNAGMATGRYMWDAAQQATQDPDHGRDERTMPDDDLPF